jgi:hypothetical protein
MSTFNFEASRALGSPVIQSLGKRLCSSCGKELRGICREGLCQTCLMRSARQEGIEAARDPDLQMPAAWKDLPESADPRPDILWAYNNQIHIKERQGKASLIYWGRCSEPPTRASHAQLSFAASNQAKFQERLDRATGQDENEGDSEKAERRAVGEIETILSKMQEGVE